MENKNKGFICPFYGEMLIWCSDAAASDISDQYDESDDACAYFFVCPCCGRDYEIFDPPKEERENDFKDYWINFQ